MKFLILFLSLFLNSCVHSTHVYAPATQFRPDPVYKSVALIHIKHKLGMATATAFAIQNINNNTYMVTVNHLCERRGRKVVAFTVHTEEAGRKRFKGKTVYSSSENDMCILRLYNTGEQFVPLRFARKVPQAGDRAYTIGAPSGTFPSKTEGYVIGHDLLGMEPDEEGVPKTLLVTTVPAYNGNSGGPVYNEQYEVIGMLAATHKKSPHSSISIHVESILKHLKLYFKKDIR